MKKLVSTIALLAILLIASSGYNEQEDCITKGDLIPELTLSQDGREVDIDDFKGDYVLLTFWSSADAQSRVDCNAYSSWFASVNPQNMKHLSVNFDCEPVLFEEIVKLDNLDQKMQFNVQGDEASQIISDFSLQQGYGSILIKPDGHIAEFNPTISELSSLI